MTGLSNRGAVSRSALLLILAAVAALTWLFVSSEQPAPGSKTLPSLETAPLDAAPEAPIDGPIAIVDEARIARRWPNRIAITVSEQVPAAIWGERGLLNVRGELFVSNARHVPAELPRLSGPDDRAGDVARRYLDVRERLIPVGLDLRSIDLDARGAWQMTLSNGIEVRLGRSRISAAGKQKGGQQANRAWLTNHCDGLRPRRASQRRIVAWRRASMG